MSIGEESCASPGCFDCLKMFYCMNFFTSGLLHDTVEVYAMVEQRETNQNKKITANVQYENHPYNR
ncbi:MAG: hypothetical protein D3905_01975 [Candidatus Electrothrix sp. AS4_5]|nr:hypothetical protein [Candidatus Electrothrix gigas]MCI5188568.1 hypothetical protein [Candidatus Electrothrix gigas]